MTNDTQVSAGDLEDHAITMFAEATEEDPTGPTWELLNDDEKALWLDRAQKDLNAPPARRAARSVSLPPLPPIAREVVEATGVDRRTHHRTEHAGFDREIASIIKAVRLLMRPAVEDQEIRKELMERGFTPFGTELVPLDDNSVVLEFVDAGDPA